MRPRGMAGENPRARERISAAKRHNQHLDRPQCTRTSKKEPRAAAAPQEHERARGAIGAHDGNRSKAAAAKRPQQSGRSKAAAAKKPALKCAENHKCKSAQKEAEAAALSGSS